MLLDFKSRVHLISVVGCLPRRVKDSGSYGGLKENGSPEALVLEYLVPSWCNCWEDLGGGLGGGIHWGWTFRFQKVQAILPYTYLLIR